MYVKCCPPGLPIFREFSRRTIRREQVSSYPTLLVSINDRLIIRLVLLINYIKLAKLYIEINL